MHDPMTVAFEVKSPWKGKRGHRPLLLTVWHCDPERDGSDDSCGWFGPNNTDADVEWAEKFAAAEWRFWFGSEYDTVNFAMVSDVAILASVWLLVRERAHRTPQYAPLTAWDMARVFGLMTCAGDNFGHLVAAAKRKPDDLTRLLLLTLRAYRKARRPWWRHPRWHMAHWQIQIPAVRSWQRWAWTRCAECGGRFVWGESPCTGQWDRKSAGWFRGEVGMYHQACYPKPGRTYPGQIVTVEETP